MPSSLFPPSKPQSLPQAGNPLGQLNLIRQAAANPQDAFQNMMQSNPRFAEFVNANKGKTPEQVAREHGIDLSGFGIR